ncbi:MAG: hypothetical protein HFI29_05335 [Lachnospiraceae bacterium]|jgi:hypothetical protein|nr:hypothetical protein [Lachnospiraceae bacterium]
MTSKEVLIQYSDMAEEVKDIRKRIWKFQREIASLEIVSDSVKGTRTDGTYGGIKITGYPTPRYIRKKAALEKNKELLERKETELLELMFQAEEYIESIPMSELRLMFRLYYIDGRTWIQVAYQMNKMYPNRRIPYTEDNCKQRNKRFFENI